MRRIHFSRIPPAAGRQSAFHPHRLLPGAGNMFTVLIIILTVLLFAGSVRADSWPREKRSTYIRIGMRGFSSDAYIDAEGDRVSLHRLQAQTYSLYSEYSYSRYVTAIVDVPAYRRLLMQESASASTQEVESPGDINLGLRLSMFTGPRDVLFLTGLFGIPIGETSNSSGLWSGDDEYDQLVMFGYAHRFAPFPATVRIDGGYRFRSSGYSDELHLAAEASVRPLSVLELQLHARAVRSVDNGAPDFSGGRYGFAANNQEYFMIGPELTLWMTDGVGISGGVFSYSSARNMPAELMFSTGIVFVFQPITGH